MTREGATSVKVLVTGGSGFIGRAVVERLEHDGHTVVVADRVAYAGRGHPEVLLGDLNDHRHVVRAVATAPDVIVHLAAMTSVLQSRSAPQAVFEHNVAMTQALWEEARQAGVPRLVLASTNAVAGRAGDRTIIDELTPPAPLTPYGATKAAAEALLSGYCHAYGISGIALRFTNAYGVGMQTKDSVIPRFIRAINRHEPVTIYGTGQQVRDFVYISDVAAAIAQSLGSSHVGPITIGSGVSVSVLELLDHLEAVTGRPIVRKHIAEQPGEMAAVRVNPRLAAQVLNWTPEVPLVDGLARVWADFQAHGDSF